MSKALGMIETKGLIGSITAADAMIKSSDVRLVKQEKISAALVTVFVEGDISAVMSAVEAGKVATETVGELIDSHVIPRPDETVRTFLKLKDFQNQLAYSSEVIKKNKSVDLPTEKEGRKKEPAEFKTENQVSTTTKDNKKNPTTPKASEKKAVKEKTEVKKLLKSNTVAKKDELKTDNKKSNKKDEK